MITPQHEDFLIYEPVREQILEYLNELGGSSTETRRSYYYSLELFFEFLFLKHPETFPNYGEKEINQFLMTLTKKSSSYINRTYIAIHNFSLHQGIPLNKKKIALPKQDNYKQIQPRSLSDDEAERIENQLYIRYVKQKEKNNSKRNIFPSTGKERDTLRNYVLYRLMIQTSLRISEALSLDFGDLHLDGKREEARYILVRGKGNKKRKVPVPLELKELLIYYVEFRKRYDEEIEYEKVYFNFINKRLTEQQSKGLEANLSKDELKLLDELAEKPSLTFGEAMLIVNIKLSALRRYIQKTFKQNVALFVSNRGQRVNKDSMMKMFKKQGITSHMLRHTAIKTLVDKGVSINKVQAISGHASADMVLRYSKPTFKEIQTEMEQSQRTFRRNFLE